MIERGRREREREKEGEGKREEGEGECATIHTPAHAHAIWEKRSVHPQAPSQRFPRCFADTQGLFLFPLSWQLLPLLCFWGKVGAITTGLSADFTGTLKEFGVKIVAGMIAWGMVAPFLSGALYLLALPLFKHLLAKKKGEA